MEGRNGDEGGDGDTKVMMMWELRLWWKVSTLAFYSMIMMCESVKV